MSNTQRALITQNYAVAIASWGFVFWFVGGLAVATIENSAQIRVYVLWGLLLCTVLWCLALTTTLLVRCPACGKAPFTKATHTPSRRPSIQRLRRQFIPKKREILEERCLNCSAKLIT